MSLDPLLPNNVVYYNNYKRISVIKEDPSLAHSFDRLDFEKASFEEVHKCALNSLDYRLVMLKETIDKELLQKRLNFINRVLIACAIAAISLAFFGIAFANLAKPNFKQTMGMISVIIPVGFGLLISSIYISYQKWYPLKHPEQKNYKLIQNQIKLLKTKHCIEFLKKEENRILYPLLTSLELGKYLSLNQTVSQYNTQANSLRAKLLV